MTSFETLGLSQYLLSTLSANGFETPTPIQAQAVPHLLEGRDLMGLAQTGTGKTFAFGLPIIARLIKEGIKAEPKSARALILAPTRELVNQIADSLKVFTRKSPLKQTSVVGGVSIGKQTEILSKGVDILIATPGRLLDLCNRNALSLTATRYLVLDEADQMMDLGFIHDLKKIVKLVPKRRQTMLFSATMPQAIADLASDYLNDPIEVSVNPSGKAADKVEQRVHFIDGRENKSNLLKDELRANKDGLALVFCKTKHGAERLMKHLTHSGFNAASIHGNKTQGQRDRALKAFREGEISILVATDVAARGIDVPGVTHVYNYDLPTVPESYVHRIGRTARAGREGIAIAFCGAEDLKMLYDIEKLMNISITVASGVRPDWQGKNKGGEGHRGRRETSRGPREEREKAAVRREVKRHEPLLKTSSFAEVHDLEIEEKPVQKREPRADNANRSPRGEQRRERPRHFKEGAEHQANPGKPQGDERSQSRPQQEPRRKPFNGNGSAHRHSPAALLPEFAGESNLLSESRPVKQNDRRPQSDHKRPEHKDGVKAEAPHREGGRPHRTGEQKPAARGPNNKGQQPRYRERGGRS